MAVWDKARDWLRGYDLVPPDGRVREQKLNFISDYGVAFTGAPDMPLVHGPGATELWSAPSPTGDGNSAVYACLAALALAYIEAPWRVYRRTSAGKREEVTTGAPGALAQLLQTPNPHMSGAEVWAWCQWAKHIDGNYYLRKERSGNKQTGNVTALWPISPTRIELISEGGDYITAYRYRPGPGRYVDIAPANIIHGRVMLDDRDQRRGLSPLKRLVRALTTDAAAEAWAERLLSNGAIPGLLVRSKLKLTQAQAQEMKAWARQLYSGEKLGDVGVLDQDADMAQFGFSPEQMAFDAVRRQPETRISAVLRVPAIVAGLAAGLERSTYANYREARDAFTEQTLLPLWSMDEAKVQAQLVPDFTQDAKILVAHDLTDVRALQEDEDAKYTRLDKAVQGGWITINEARSDVGLDDLPGGDVRRLPVAVQEVPVGETAAAIPPQPAPGGAQPPATAPNGTAPIPISSARAAASLGPWDAKAGDPATVTAADVRAWRQRTQALEDEAPLLPALLAATARTNGHGQH